MTEVQQQLLETNPPVVISKPFVSVIVPVYNDAERLKKCLAALEQQTYDPNRFEVIVVDNGSDPDQKVDNCATEFDHVIVTHESIPSSYAARNKGISIAKGEILAFTDADCIPSPSWLEKGVKHLLDNPNCGIVGGKIEMFFQDPNNITAVELYDKVIFGFPYEEMLNSHGGIITANLFARKSVVEEVGGFLSQLKSFGDQEWGMRVKAAGYQQLYAKDACVSHPVRKSLKTQLRRRARCSGGVFDMYVRQESSPWVRNRRFVRLVLQDLFLDSFCLAKDVFESSELNGIVSKIQVLGVVAIMQSYSAFEKIRLKFGGESKR